MFSSFLSQLNFSGILISAVVCLSSFLQLEIHRLHTEIAQSHQILLSQTQALTKAVDHLYNLELKIQLLNEQLRISNSAVTATSSAVNNNTLMLISSVVIIVAVASLFYFFTSGGGGGGSQITFDGIQEIVKHHQQITEEAIMHTGNTIITNIKLLHPVPIEQGPELMVPHLSNSVLQAISQIPFT